MFGGFAAVEEKLVGAAEDDESHLTVAEDGQLHRLLHKPCLPLHERCLICFGGKPESYFLFIYFFLKLSARGEEEGRK